MKVVKDLYFLIALLWSGKGIEIFYDPLFLVVFWALGLLLFASENLSPKKTLVYALSIWFIYFSINTITILSFHPLFMSTYVAKIMIAYWFVCTYKEYIFEKYESFVFYLSVISLFFYIFQILNQSLVYNTIGYFDLAGELFPRAYYESIGIYTFHQKEMVESWPRNSGFTWEPGPFSCFIAFSIFINLARNGIKFIDFKRLPILILTLLTTQSTTGIVVLMAILLWYGWAQYSNAGVRFLMTLLTIVLSVPIYLNVPILGEKISLQSKQTAEDVIALAAATGESYTPGRFSSLQLRIQDFRNYPIAGFGGNVELQAGYLGEGNVVHAVNGVGTIFGRYGLIGAALFFIMIYRTGRWLAGFYAYSGSWVFGLLMVLMGFSFDVIESPIFASLWLSSVFLPKSPVRSR